MNKLVSSISIGAITTFALFAFMAHLISSADLTWTETEKPAVITIFQTPDEPKVIVKERPKMTPPPPQMVPRVPNEAPQDITDVAMVGYQLTGLDVISDFDGSKGVNMAPDSDARPLVRVNPKYPITAARDGIEGWVNLSFDINEIGEVVNINVIEAMPKKTFNKAAKDALRKWKYRAKLVDGKPIVQHNLSVLLEFTMEQRS